MTRRSRFQDRVRRVHMVGIGGAGMSGIAEVLMRLGFTVTGSDLADSEAVRRLRRLGAVVHPAHDAAQVEGADVLVVSSAIAAGNPEIAAARAARIPVVPRAEMLGELMRFREGIAVAGSHGKTTTTSLTASLLAAGGLDPTCVIGGVVNAFGSHARLGGGSYLVAEADESDGTFLLLQPMIAVVTNIDRDHLGHYGGRFDRLVAAFEEFVHHVPFYGLVVIAGDDPELQALAPRIHRPLLVAGLAADAGVRASAVVAEGLAMRFMLHLPGAAPQPVRLNLPGVHNVQNALCAAAVAYELGVDARTIAAALGEFGGVGRRFALIGRWAVAGGEAELYEDYAHHPREIAAVMAAARAAWPGRRLVVVFQPHRYSRTRDLIDEFAAVLAAADVLLVAPVYAAGEAVIEEGRAERLCRTIRSHGKVEPVYLPELCALRDRLPRFLAAGDHVLLLGAGDIGRLSAELRSELAEAAA